MLARLRPSRQLLQVLLPVVLVLSVPALGLAYAPDKPGSDESVSGELLLLHADDFRNGRASAPSYALRTARGFEAVDMSHIGRARQLAGRHVRLTGERSDGKFRTSSVLATADSTASATAVTTRRVAVILVNFTNDTSQPWTAATVSNVLFGASSSVNAYYREVSYGTTELTGNVLGWYTIPYDNSGCRYSDWARAAETAAGVDLSSYQHVVYAFPRASSCGWSGLGSLRGRYSWINGSMTVRVVGHELGHNLGVHHAGALSCTENGVRVTLSASCTLSEYGDPFSIMGSTTRHQNNWHRAQIGWLPETTTVTTGGTYTVSAASLTTAPRLVRVARGNGTYFYLEHRVPFGAYDNFLATDPVVNGVTIRLAPDVPTRTQSQLLDTTPSTSSFGDAPLTVGRTFSDPTSGLTVTTLSVSATSATVTISFNGSGGGSDTQAPTAPGGFTATPASTTSMTLAWHASSDNVGVAGYRLYRNGALIATRTSPGYTDSGLAPGTTYSYSVAAFDAAGNTSPASTTSGTTPSPPDTSAPSAPSGLDAAPTSPTTVSLSWGASTDNVGVTGYRVFRNGALVATKSAADRSHADAGLTPSTSYQYAVEAFDAAGNTGPAATATATTPADPGPGLAPAAPTNLTATKARKGKTVTLAWNAGAGGGAPASYRVYRNGALVATVTATGYADSVPGNVSTATYYVVAVSASGLLSPASSSVSVSMR